MKSSEKKVCNWNVNEHEKKGGWDPRAKRKIVLCPKLLLQFKIHCTLWESYGISFCGGFNFHLRIKKVLSWQWVGKWNLSTSSDRLLWLYPQHFTVSPHLNFFILACWQFGADWYFHSNIGTNFQNLWSSPEV